MRHKMGAGLLIGILLLSLVTLSSFSASYPEKPVNIVVQFAPGGSTDVLARMIAAGLEKIFNQRFVIINKPGAGGEIGYLAVANSEPDGYTIGFTNTTSHLVIPLTKPEGTTYSLDDFVQIACIAIDPGILVVKADSPFQTIQDYIDYAKENPNKITVTHDGPGGDDYLAIKYIENAANIKLKYVQYEGNAPAMVDLLGGHVASGALNVSQVYTLIKAGNLRALAIMDDSRIPELAGVPTFKELGMDVISNASRGISGPVGIPDEILKTLADAIGKVVLEDPDFTSRAKEMLLPIKFKPLDEYKELLRTEYRKLEKIWEEDPWL